MYNNKLQMIQGIQAKPKMNRYSPWKKRATGCPAKVYMSAIQILGNFPMPSVLPKRHMPRPARKKLKANPILNPFLTPKSNEGIVTTGL